MNKDEKRNYEHEKYEYNEEMEDVTKYGEFISSYFAWVPLKKQKRRVNELENMTKDDNK